MSNITVKLNKQFLAVSIASRIKTKSQVMLDSQVLKDSNFYAPKRDGYLQSSGIRATVLGSGMVIWDSIYAGFQYWTDNNKSKDQNPNARRKWFEFAKSKKKQQWVTLSNEEYKKP